MYYPCRALPIVKHRKMFCISIGMLVKEKEAFQIQANSIQKAFHEPCGESPTLTIYLPECH